MDADYSKVGKALASPARSKMVGALFEGRALTASELARVAGVGLSTASEHLRELVEIGLVRVAAEGRHKYFALAGGDVAEALEALSRICPFPEIRSLGASVEARGVLFARTCYDHVAGVLGVALLEAFLGRDWLIPVDREFSVGPFAQEGFRSIGVEVERLRKQRRVFARSCMDWTARRAHLGGALGAAVCGSLIEREWIVRAKGRRGLRVTAVGEAQLLKTLGIELVNQEEVRHNPVAR